MFSKIDGFLRKFLRTEQSIFFQRFQGKRVKKHPIYHGFCGFFLHKDVLDKILIFFRKMFKSFNLLTKNPEMLKKTTFKDFFGQNLEYF